MRQIESRDSGTERDLRLIEFRDSWIVPELSGILVPKCRDFLSRGILVAGLSCRFLSQSRLSRDFESRSWSREFVERDWGPDIVPGQPPIPILLLTVLLIFYIFYVININTIEWLFKQNWFVQSITVWNEPGWFKLVYAFATLNPIIGYKKRACWI